MHRHAAQRLHQLVVQGEERLLEEADVVGVVFSRDPGRGEDLPVGAAIEDPPGLVAVAHALRGNAEQHHGIPLGEVELLAHLHLAQLREQPHFVGHQVEVGLVDQHQHLERPHRDRLADVVPQVGGLGEAEGGASPRGSPCWDLVTRTSFWRLPISLKGSGGWSLLCPSTSRRSSPACQAWHLRRPSQTLRRPGSTPTRPTDSRQGARGWQGKPSTCLRAPSPRSSSVLSCSLRICKPRPARVPPAEDPSGRKARDCLTAGWHWGSPDGAWAMLG